MKKLLNMHTGPVITFPVHKESEIVIDEIVIDRPCSFMASNAVESQIPGNSPLSPQVV